VIIELAERGLAPDILIRMGIRRMLKKRLGAEQASNLEAVERRKVALMKTCAEGPIAVEQHSANEQHYEVPAGFYKMVLGARLKYSSGYWSDKVRTLTEAEETMLALTCERAELESGQSVLELGCGWGSLSLWMAEKYPASSITAVSNSTSQKAYIDQSAQDRGLHNLRVITADAATLSAPGTFDRVVSVEMFEHMRNHGELMQRIHQWLAPGGKLFVHIFCHKDAFYPFEVEGEQNWMGRMFFTGGVMPSFDLLDRSQECFTLEQSWRVNGVHYARSLEAWLDNADARREEVLPLLAQTYGREQAKVWLQRWRMFFMACSELFGYADGEEWFVGHYLFKAD
jgi:cyclopropane-fatty-acyl-phospholipid synthase